MARYPINYVHQAPQLRYCSFLVGLFSATLINQNKAISAIPYNHLNLPQLLTITGKGTIQFIYEAAGTKLRKIVTDNIVTPAKVTTTDYLGGIWLSKNESAAYWTAVYLALREASKKWTMPIGKLGHDPESIFYHFRWTGENLTNPAYLDF